MLSTVRYTGISAISQSARRSLLRFPLVLLSAALSTGIAISWILSTKTESFDHYLLSSGRIFLLSLLGIPLLYSLTLIAERGASVKTKLLPWLGVFALALYYLRIREVSDLQAPEAFFFELAAIWFGLHFLAAFAPYLRAGEARGFWEYNRSLFLRFLLALLFSLTLWFGVGIFFAVISMIANQDLSKVYWILALFILGIFNTWFFLSGVPENWTALDQEPRPFPRALKFFGQFVLIPLVTLIGIGLEILFFKAWANSYQEAVSIAPSFLPLGGVGLLTFLLLYPLSSEADGKWLHIFRRGLAVALLVPLLLLAYGSFGEIKTQGITPPTYFLLLLSAWGLALAIYLALARQVQIRWIPMSLSLLAALSVLPGSGAAAFTRRSQQHRLDALFQQFGLQKGEPDLAKIVALNPEARAQIVESEDRLLKYLGCGALRPSFGETVNLDQKTEGECRSARLRAALDPDSGPKNLEVAELPLLRLNFNLKSSPSYRGVEVNGFDYYFSDSNIDKVYPAGGVTFCAKVEETPTLCTIFNRQKDGLEIFFNGQALGRVDLKPYFSGLVAGQAADLATDNSSDRYYDLSKQQSIYDVKLRDKQLRLIFSHVFLEKRGTSLMASGIDFSALLK